MLQAGFDFGTSGARVVVIDSEDRELFTAKTSYNLADATTWQPALYQLIKQIPLALRQELGTITIAGTSGTFVVCDSHGNVQLPVQLYNDPSGRSALPLLQSICPESPVVLSSTSTLARLVHLRPLWQPDWQLVHHCDRLAYFLHRHQGVTDWHNALKLGFDPITLTYPHSILALGFNLPQVVAPGTIVAPIAPPVAKELDINPDCHITSGTTDSNAAFLAAVGENFQLGTAVTSLGSTLTVKILSRQPIFSRDYGVYSHRWNYQGQTYWLVGGASNTGGAVLAHFFSPDQIATLSSKIDPDQPTSFNYYPLLQPGERFPIPDPDLAPCLTPRPDRAELFLQGILEGIARIECLGYARLRELGAEAIQVLYTVGGGAKNATWTAIRQNYLVVTFLAPRHPEAAYGAALLPKIHGCPPSPVRTGLTES
ncbi:MAG: FGGY-family carbohydrate kinase [Pseudanabaenaceae cyanobacterium SKYGB_i_bin29]|nr:FGGY-family carbohydrate kinase [Pseudanabaenaceae cyanobacterium SKYG29]MDW8421872.1 FGGY-family carbohydrate kinase [Pseudanabaenaceae cyanobacterium SKYGB_i_bin29]